MMTWTKEKVHALLDGNSKAVERALVAIYKRQTSAEQASLSTTQANGIGFSAFDAEFCSNLAQKVERGWRLSPKQIAVARNKMKRYHRQLCEVANERENQTQAVEFGIEAAQPLAK